MMSTVVAGSARLADPVVTMQIRIRFGMRTRMRRRVMPL
jgi:hypothetical protein